MTNITRHITDRQNIITSRFSIIMLCFGIITLLLLNITLLTGTILGIPISTVSALSYQNSTDVSFTFDPILSISVSPDSITVPTIAPGTTDTSNTITVNVSTNTAYGYSLLASVGNNTDYNTSDLVHSSSTIDSTFTSIATNASLPQLDTDNTWGYSTSLDNGSTWSTYHGLPLYSTVDNNTSTTSPALLMDTKSPADSKSIDFRIAARASSTQPSGTYSNVINFYAVGKPAPPILYEEVAKMSKGAQTLADMRAEITYPTNRDYHEDTSNSGVYEYDSAVFGVSSDANNNYKIYYYRGVLEPEGDQGTYGSDGKATTYPNYVRFSNNTCWRIVRTTGSGGVKMIYNGTWTGATCANKANNAQLATSSFNDPVGSIVYAGYSYNRKYTNNNTTNGVSTDIVLGSNNNPAQNNDRSTIKTYIEDTWYAGNMTSYIAMLEPAAGYCNDRSLYDNDRNPITNVYVDQINFFGAANRNFSIGTNPDSKITLTCPRGEVDNYYYATNNTGVSNKLKYPAALLTADEAAMAGSGVRAGDSSNYNPRSFLRSGNEFWLLSPYARYQNSYVVSFFVSWDGSLSVGTTNTARGVRPAISLKPGMAIVSGTGTATDPWVVSAQ